VNHVLDDILADHNSLSETARAHIRQCASCRRELEIMQHMQKAIEKLPERPAPERVKIAVIALMRRPNLRTWHFLVASVLLVVSPFVISRFSSSFHGASIGEEVFIAMCAFFGALTVLVLVPVTMRMMESRSSLIRDLEKNFDRYLDSILK